MRQRMLCALVAMTAIATTLTAGQTVARGAEPALTGRVLDVGGAPRAGALVSVMVEDDDSFGLEPAASVTTGADGAFAFPSATLPATYVVRVCQPRTADSCVSHSGAPFLAAYVGSDLTAHLGMLPVPGYLHGPESAVGLGDIRLTAPGSLTGHVSPARATKVDLLRLDGRGIDTVATDAAGAYTFTGLVPGAFRLQTKDRSSVTPRPVDVRVVAGQATVTDLTEWDTQVQVSLAVDRAPARKVKVRITQLAVAYPQVREEKTDKRGRATFTALAPGQYSVTTVAAASDDKKYRTAPIVSRTVAVLTDHSVVTAAFRLRTRQFGAVHARTAFRSGYFPTQTVTVYDTAGNLVTGGEAEGRGRELKQVREVTIPGLAPGRYYARVDWEGLDHRSHLTAVRKVRVRANRVRDLGILRSPKKLGKVEGAAPVGSFIGLRLDLPVPPDSELASTYYAGITSGADGHYQIRGVGKGRYRVALSRSYFNLPWLDPEPSKLRMKGKTAHVDLAGGALGGEIRGVASNPATGTPWPWYTDHRVDSLTCERDGEPGSTYGGYANVPWYSDVFGFAVAGLPSGTYECRTDIFDADDGAPYFPDYPDHLVVQQGQVLDLGNVPVAIGGL